ncbi:dihydrodipicolinate synthase family protein [Tsukamurella soli]|uniref:dihydrodipicolinate synthase family protein n=1 Tax=Tsukamurella soli TaxID=644556 RepID=UPI0036209DE7
MTATIPTIVGFMPTPFASTGQVDSERLSALAGDIAAAGIRPAVLGGMGEYYALDHDESRQCMEAAVAGAGGVPVVAGIGWATREAVAIASDAARLGIHTAVINPPHYASPSPRAYAEHVRRVTDAAGTGAIVYSAAHFPMTDAYLDRLVQVDGFRGVKEEHYDVATTADRARRWGDRVEWWGWARSADQRMRQRAPAPSPHRSRISGPT